MGTYVPGGRAVVCLRDVVISFAMPAHWERSVYIAVLRGCVGETTDCRGLYTALLKCLSCSDGRLDIRIAATASASFPGRTRHRYHNLALSGQSLRLTAVKLAGEDRIVGYSSTHVIKPLWLCSRIVLLEESRDCSVSEVLGVGAAHHDEKGHHDRR